MFANNVSGSAKPVLIDLPGYGVNRRDAPQFQQDESKLPAPVYKIPPAIWVIVFLVGGYLGIRWIMED